MLDSKIKTLFILFFSVPVSLFIFISQNLFFKAVNEEHEVRNTSLTIVRSFLATFIPFLLMIYGYRRNSVNKSGAIFGVICAIILSLASMVYLFVLAAFFFSGSRATKFRESEKKKIEKDFKSGGQRNWMQVLCNGGFPTFLALTQIIEGMIGERPIDFQNNFIGSILGIGIMSSFACCCGDTLASELSPVVSKSDPILITTGRKVPKGTNGGITLEGLFFSLMGGAVVGFTYWLFTFLLVDKTTLSACTTPQYPIIILGGVSGLFGSLIDSILGATCQYSGQTDDGYIVEKPGTGVKKISGNLRILNNHSVNLLSSIITGIFIPLVSINFWIPFTHSY